MTSNRVGFACKFSELHPTKGIVTIPELNCKTTTIAWLQRQSRQEAVDRLLDIAKHNVNSIKNVITRLAKLDPELRMFRISSDILPAYTHPDYQFFYRDTTMRNLFQRWFAALGETARTNNVRLSFHPDQFVVLASDREEVVENSIREFEYHVDMARWMGYGKTFQDMKINVHISGRQGPDGIKKVMSRLSPEARNCITIENDEMSWGIDSSLELADTCALVLDIHHHWVMTGEYIKTTDDRIKYFIDSWRGIRPVIHFSISREEYLSTHSIKDLPNNQILL